MSSTPSLRSCQHFRLGHLDVDVVTRLGNKDAVHGVREGLRGQSWKITWKMWKTTWKMINDDQWWSMMINAINPCWQLHLHRYIDILWEKRHHYFVCAWFEFQNCNTDWACQLWAMPLLAPFKRDEKALAIGLALKLSMPGIYKQTKRNSEPSPFNKKKESKSYKQNKKSFFRCPKKYLQ